MLSVQTTFGLGMGVYVPKSYCWVRGQTIGQLHLEVMSIMSTNILISPHFQEADASSNQL